MSQTTVMLTVNHSGASYVIKLGGVTDADGVIELSVGGNTITVEVTAEDDSTTRTYTITVTRAEPATPEQLSSDATLSALTLSNVDFGRFDSTTVSYTAQVANSVSQTTVAPTVNHSGASYVIKLGGVTDADGVIVLGVGSNVITVEVTAEDGITSRTYTVAVTRSAPPSTDATLSALTLSGVDIGAFAPGTISYTAQVANSVTQTTVTATTNHSGASYEVKLGGAVDDDGIVPLSVGKNNISVVVTAEDGITTRVYTAVVAREGSPVTIEFSPASPVDEGTDVTVTMSFEDLTMDSSADLLLRADVVDDEGVPANACEGTGIGIDQMMHVVDENPEVRTGIVSANCPQGDYSIEVNLTSADDAGIAFASADFSVVPLNAEGLRERMMDLYDTNDDDVIDRAEAIAAIRDYFNGLLTKAETIAVISLYFSSSA